MGSRHSRASFPAERGCSPPARGVGSGASVSSWLAREAGALGRPRGGWSAPPTPWLPGPLGASAAVGGDAHAGRDGGWVAGLVVPIPTRRSSEAAIRHLADRDLEELRRALARSLRELHLGSPASQIVGRLNRLTRAELRRRGRRDSRPDAA